MKRVIAGTFVAAAFAVGLSRRRRHRRAAAARQPPQSQPMQEPKDAAQDRDGHRLSEGRRGGRRRILLSDLKWSQDKAVGTSGSRDASTAPAVERQLAEARAARRARSSATTLATRLKSPARSATRPTRLRMARQLIGSSAAKREPSLNVSDVKMIAATCTPVSQATCKASPADAAGQPDIGRAGFVVDAGEDSLRASLAGQAPQAAA